MSDAVLALRELALSRATQDHPLHVVLDDGLRDELAVARRNLDVLTEQREKMSRDGDLAPAAPASLADVPAAPVADIDRILTAAREVVTSIEDEALAAGKVLVLHFRHISPVSYQNEVDAASDVAKTYDDRFMSLLGDALIPLCFTSASTPTGEDVALTLDELLAGILNHGDIDTVRSHCITINRARQAVPFTQRNSGAPATN